MVGESSYCIVHYREILLQKLHIRKGRLFWKPDALSANLEPDEDDPIALKISLYVHSYVHRMTYHTKERLWAPVMRV